MQRATIQITLLSTLLLAASHALAAPQTPTDKVVQAFMALDTDGSDGVSQQEYLRMVEKRARQRFRQMDANRDGEVNEQEYRAFWQNQRAKWYRLRR